MSQQDQLYDLYLLDQRVRGLRLRLDAAIRRRDTQQARLAQLKQQLAELQAQHKQAQAHASTLEHQANDVEARIAGHREQMNSVTSNKQYHALLVEMNTLKIEKGKFEEEALEHLQKVDATKAQIDEVQSRADEQRKLADAAEHEVAEARAEVGDKLDEVQAERDAAAGKLATDVLSNFERLARQHDGEVMAEVEDQDLRRREFICGGCYIQLPVERVSNIMRHKDELVTCPSCGRFLYIAEKLKSALTPASK